MKICTVCQYEEELDSETSWAICGSDLESSVTTQPPAEPEPVGEESKAPEDNDEKVKEPESEPVEESSKSDEEKLLEEIT